MKRLLALFALLPAFAAAAPAPDVFDAIFNNNIGQLKSILAADPAAATTPAKKGMTPLHYAANLNRQEAAYVLLKAGVDPNGTIPASQTTPLHWAADADSADVLRLLLKNGAAADARAKYGLTPLHLAARKGAVASIERLLEAGADPNAADESGNTPLHDAASKDRAAAVTALLARGADPERANKRGKKPVELANDPATRAAFGAKDSAPAAADVQPAPGKPAAAPAAPPPVAFEAGGKTPAECYETFAKAAGTLRLDDNTLYNGGWSHGRMDGRGVHVINAEGERYEGEFRRGRRHGRGRYVYPNGDVLDCEWDDDVPDGPGSFTFATGGTVRGVWKNGALRDGNGTFSSTSGAQSYGVWQDGVLVSSQPVAR